MLMAKNAVLEKFPGRHSDSVSLIRDWELYVQMLGGRRQITDTILLWTLGGHSLDDGTRMNLQPPRELVEITRK